MDRWFVLVDEQQQGPLTTERLIAHLQTRNPARVYVWRDGFTNWKFASEVPELAAPPPPPLVAELDETQEARLSNSGQKKYRKYRWFKIGAAAGLVFPLLNLFAGRITSFDPAYLLGYFGASVVFAAAIGFVIGALVDAVRGPTKKAAFEKEKPKLSGRTNFVATYWRGDLPLWISYWIINFLGSFLLGWLFLMLAGVFKLESGYNPFSIFAVFAITWLCVLVIGTWQLVGLWRSANNYSEARFRSGQKAFWGGLAKVAVVFGVIGSVSAIARDGVPQLVEVSRIAFQNDPDIPDYSIRVMRDGTEAEIVGGFKFGLTDDFAKILGASRQIKVVHLDSIGGRLGEGEKMFKLIRDRGIATYVSTKCNSACTLAFAGGRERHLHKNGSLGFHRGAFPGLVEGELDSVQRKVFKLAGFDERFISTALSTPHKDMWRPTAQVLMAAKVITAIADGSTFAYSGLGTDFTKEKIAEGLAKALPVFAAVRARFPTQYEAMTEQYLDSLLKGKTEIETIDAIRAKLMPLIKSLLPLADDDVLADYSRLILDQYRELNSKNPTYCYLYASGEQSKVNLQNEMSKSILQRELDLLEKAVKTASKRVPIDKPFQEALWTKVRAQMVAGGVTDADWAIFETTKVPTTSHVRYCAVATIMMGEISRLPRRESAILMRDVLAQANP